MSGTSRQDLGDSVAGEVCREKGVRRESGRAVRGPVGTLPCVSDDRATLVVRGAITRTAQGPVPREESRGGLGLPSPGCPCSLLSVGIQTSLGNGGLGACKDGTPR